MKNTPPNSVEPSSVQSGTPSDTSVTLPPVSPDSSPDTLGTFVSPGEAGWLAPLQLIGTFSIVRILGEGGMGTVYLAEDVRLKRKAAIKMMKLELASHPENRERFRREAQAAAAIEHDNIIPIWQIGEAADGSPFIAMPFLQGEMLESRLKREPIQPLGVILKVAGEVAEGLAAAHEKGLIHRDIKPANVWIEGDPESGDPARQVRRCKILDFGLARCAEVADSNLTASGAIMGTPAYMAPEQASGQKVDHRADLFSLGVMLYRMTTGKAPFEGPTVMALLYAIVNDTPPPASDLNPSLPPELSDLIGRLMSKDPRQRPQSAAEVAAAIRRIAKQIERTSNDTFVPELESTPKAEAKRSRTPLLVVLGLLALVPVGWLATVLLRLETDKGTLVVEIDDADVEARIKNGKLVLTGPDDKVRYAITMGERDKKLEAGAYKIRVEGADGLTLDTSEFTLKKGGKVTVRVRMEPKAVAKGLDPDRKAAEYVLSIGGVVRVGPPGESEWEITAATDLPQADFLLKGVQLKYNKRVTDKGLAHFKDCKNLTSLSLWGTFVSEVGLACFEECKNLTHLELSGTQVSDAGVAHFKDCKKLMVLELQLARVSDAGLAHFKGCKNLRVLNLYLCNRVSDAGLAHFEGCKHLTFLSAGNSQVGDAGLAHLEGCKNLTYLELSDTKVGDAGLARLEGRKNIERLFLGDTQVSDTGLAYFKECKNLSVLDLNGTKVSDAGLAHFEDCEKLMELNLKKTKVTAAKIAALKKALPRCKIEWEGGAIDPTADPDRKAAAWVLSVKGLVCVNGEERSIATAGQLPGGAFRLTTVDLRANKQAGDGGLACFRGCNRLTYLNLDNTKVGDAGLAHFAGCKSLTYLNLDNTKVSDSGLAHFEGCNNLKNLSLNGTKVSDAGVAHFKNCTGLLGLYLNGTKVEDKGLAHFKGCKSLKILNLQGTQASDSGLAYFKDCKNITNLYLGDTKASDAGLAYFEGCKSLAVLMLHGAKVGDAGVAHFKACKNLRILNLTGTKVSNAGLAHLEGCKGLTHLTVKRTEVTAAKVEALKKALPACKIEWDGGVIEPRP